MSHSLAQRAAATIIKEEKLTPDSVCSPLSDERLLIPIRKHVRMRSPLALARIILTADRPIDVNGFELNNGRSLLREAAALTILVEIEQQLFEAAQSARPKQVAVRVG